MITRPFGLDLDDGAILNPNWISTQLMIVRKKCTNRIPIRNWLQLWWATVGIYFQMKIQWEFKIRCKFSRNFKFEWKFKVTQRESLMLVMTFSFALHLFVHIYEVLMSGPFFYNLENIFFFILVSTEIPRKKGITDACSTADCCSLLTICPSCCLRHAPDPDIKDCL